MPQGTGKTMGSEVRSQSLNPGFLLSSTGDFRYVVNFAATSVLEKENNIAYFIRFSMRNEIYLSQLLDYLVHSRHLLANSGIFPSTYTSSV